jgi:hypothetical protein
MATRIRRSIELDEEALRIFDEFYPSRGSLTWFVEEALKHFVAIHTQEPSALIYDAVANVTGLKEEE